MSNNISPSSTPGQEATTVSASVIRKEDAPKLSLWKKLLHAFFGPSPPPGEVAHPRSLGLKAFDVFLYPILTNFAVFGISVGATYLTSKGKQHGKIGEWFQKRGDWMTGKFQNMGMSHGQADMAKMVFFSFADGSLMAPVVKKFEDNREPIGKWIDCNLGSGALDESVYAAEPKQTWGSVLGGRLATCAIVVPTAVALDKTGLNDVMFTNPGRKLGEAITKKPGLMKMFGKLDVPELSKIAFFEYFYTSVCTAGLYFASRFMSRATADKNKEEAIASPPLASSLLSETQDHHVPTEERPKQWRTDKRAPQSFRDRHKQAVAQQTAALII